MSLPVTRPVCDAAEHSLSPTGTEAMQLLEMAAARRGARVVLGAAWRVKVIAAAVANEPERDGEARR